MTKLSVLMSVVVLVIGCRDKQSAKQQAAPQTGSAQPAGRGSAWIESVPQVGTGDVGLMLHRATGVVGVNADGSLVAGPAPAKGATDDPLAGAKPVQLGSLAETLGLPPVTKRTTSAFGAHEGEGSGSARAAENPSDALFEQLGHPEPATGAPPPPVRATSAFAIAHPHDVSAGVVVFADPKAPASAVVDVLAQTGGFLAVRNGAKVGALSLAMDRREPPRVPPGRRWVEVRLGAASEVAFVPGESLPVASPDKLGDVVKTTSAKAVDVLVDESTRTQDLVRTIEQLRAAGVDAIGIGRRPADMAARAKQAARVIAWDYYAQGIDATLATSLRTALDGALEPTRACYQGVLAKSPAAAGTVQIDLFVAPNLKADVTATGGPPALATCITTAAKALTFPKPGEQGAKIGAKLTFVP